MAKIGIENTEITVLSIEERDYISLTDMANYKESESRAADVIMNWLRTRYAIEFLSIWEQINNPNFKVVESDHFKIEGELIKDVIVAKFATSTLNGAITGKQYWGAFFYEDYRATPLILKTQSH